MNKQVTMTLEDRLASLKDSVRNLVDFSSDTAGVLKHKAIDVKDTVVSGGSSAARKLGGVIKDHPIAAVGIAFGIGFIAMRLMRK